MGELVAKYSSSDQDNRLNWFGKKGPTICLFANVPDQPALQEKNHFPSDFLTLAISIVQMTKNLAIVDYYLKFQMTV